MMSRVHGGCRIVLGSATPSLEEIYNTRTGRHALVTLSERYHGDGHTEVEIIDTKAERRKRGMIGSISRKLLDHMKAALAAKEQILVLRSRKAWATALQCDECGEIQKCPHCNVSMSLHKTGGNMVCHSCGYYAPYTGQCRKCSGKLTPLGAGTQKIEEEISTLFPDAVTARLDSDSSHQEKIIKEFAKGEIDILVGTQMIGKGFDFSNLSLVAVIAADSMLGIQDFRADEKASQLLEQFGGRCGRRGRKATFVIQTSQPEHPIYTNLSGTALDDFRDTLLAERQDFGFPPYSRIIEITVRDRFEERAERMSHWLGEKLAGFNITGPYTPAIDKVADNYIRNLRICLPKDKTLTTSKRNIRNIIAGFEKSRKYDGHITIDVDPS
jgi:primosomal protein N' (replication factor Y)